MKDGMDIKTYNTRDTDLKDSELMINSLYEEIPPLKRRGVSSDSIVFKLSNPNKNVNFEFVIKQGECLSVYLKKNIYVNTLRDALFLQNDTSELRLSINSVCYDKKQIRKMIGNSIIFLDESPTEKMLFSNLSFMQNLSILLESKSNLRLKRISDGIYAELADEFGSKLRMKSIKPLTAEEKFSLVYNKVLLLNPRLVIIITPFIGKNALLKKQIEQHIKQIKLRNCGVVLFSLNRHDCEGVEDYATEWK